MGNDMRKISAASLAILTNVHAIAVSQDPLGQMGIRVTPDIPQQIWARVLANGDRAVALYNKGEWTAPKQPPIPHGNCPNWTATGYGYYEASGPAKNVGSFSDLTVEQAQNACCANPRCAGFNFTDGAGFYKANALGGFVTAPPPSAGYYKPNQIGRSSTGQHLTCSFLVRVICPIHTLITAK